MMATLHLKLCCGACEDCRFYTLQEVCTLTVCCRAFSGVRRPHLIYVLSCAYSAK